MRRSSTNACRPCLTALSSVGAALIVSAAAAACSDGGERTGRAERSVVFAAGVDSDGDGIPDDSDACPNGPEPPGGSLDLPEPDPEVVTTCAPTTTHVWAHAPTVPNACDPPVIVGFLTNVGGVELGSGRIPLGDELDVLAPIGTHRVSWEIRDEAGNVHATVEQELEVVASSTTCCELESLVVMGTRDSDSLLAMGPPSCLFGEAGDDFVAAGISENAISGDDGDDYLAGGGGDDVLLGGDGNDYLQSGSDGSVRAYGGAGDDFIDMTSAEASLVVTGSGRDLVVGSAGDDEVFVGPGAVLVTTGDGDDTVTLYDGCDATEGLHLVGGAGDDTLVSPLSRNELRGLGVTFEGFETVTVDDERRYLSDCFSGE